MAAPLRHSLLALLLVSTFVPIAGFVWLELGELAQARATHERDAHQAAALQAALRADAAVEEGLDPLAASAEGAASEAVYLVTQNGSARDATGIRPWPELRDRAGNTAAGFDALRTPAGEERHVAWARAPAADVFVVLVRPLAEGNGGPPLPFIILTAFSATSVAVIIGFIILRVLQPVARLEIASRRLARGEWHERVPVEGPLEVRTLASAFNEMASTLEAQSRHVTALLDTRTRTLIDREEDLDTLRFTLAHEFREPLRSVRWIADDLLERPLDDDAHHAAQLIRRRVDAMDKVFRDLLRYEEISRRAAPMGTIQLPALISHACEDAMLKGALDMTMGPIPETIVGNEELLQVAFDEILLNAVKHGRSPNRRASVHITASEEDGGLVIHVDDDGPGIPAARREDALHLFQRLRRDIPGTGAGLALARRAVERHGGALTLGEAPGKGARVIVRFPSSTPAPGNAPASPRPPLKRSF